ncbi:MAG: DUF721 domain-containing protein, partial [Selenomonadaceae bacterium]|nr:DUF721 domain-containing protein [Selenomonadaceae bacterium]
CSELNDNWDKLVDTSLAAKVKPVKLERGVLFVDVESSALKDQLKFLAEEIIDAINETFSGTELRVKAIRIAKSFQIADKPPDKELPAQVAVQVAEPTLTAEEIKRCEAQAEKISDAELRRAVLDTLLSQAKIQKRRRADDWHKCAKCETLCPPEEIFCEVCRLKEREAMVKELYKIFYDEPWLKTRDAQKLLLKKMPHMKCPLDVIDSARTSLIQNLASHIRFGDENSSDVLKLVMLEKRLTPDKITPAIISRALADLHFNLADLPKRRF